MEASWPSRRDRFHIEFIWGTSSPLAKTELGTCRKRDTCPFLISSARATLTFSIGSYRDGVFTWENFHPAFRDLTSTPKRSRYAGQPAYSYEQKSNFALGLIRWFLSKEVQPSKRDSSSQYEQALKNRRHLAGWHSTRCDWVSVNTMQEILLYDWHLSNQCLFHVC